MKKIKPNDNPQQWPRKATSSVECRKRDLVIRIANWTRDKEEPAFDVEVYVAGVYDWNLSESFTKHKYGDLKVAKVEAVKFAQKQVESLL